LCIAFKFCLQKISDQGFDCCMLMSVA